MIVKNFAEALELRKESDRLEQIAFEKQMDRCKNCGKFDISETEEWERMNEINEAIDVFVKNNPYIVWDVHTGHRIEYFSTEEAAKKFAEQNPHYEVTTM